MLQYIKFKLQRNFISLEKNCIRAIQDYQRRYFGYISKVSPELFFKGGLCNFLNLEGTSCNHHRPQGRIVKIIPIIITLILKIALIRMDKYRKFSEFYFRLKNQQKLKSSQVSNLQVRIIFIVQWMHVSNGWILNGNKKVVRIIRGEVNKN